MKTIILTNSKLSGDVIPPASKSILHRYIIAASLSDGVSKLVNITLSEDIKATINAMEMLGAKIKIEKGELLIKGSSFSGALNTKYINIDCNESGSTLRFLIPICIVKNNRIIFSGKNSLFKRPLEPYFKIFEKNNISFDFLPEKKEKLKINGMLKSGNYEILGNISSQFISGLLFALPLLNGDSIIEIKGTLESKSYVELTLDCLSKFGIEFKNEEYKKIYIKGSQKYKTQNINVESDFSQAAFFFVANSLGANLNIKNINLNSLQGDKEILSLIQKIEKDKKEELIVDGSNCPDIIPIFCLLSAYSNKKIKIINIGRLRIKECDRLCATVSELSKLGFDLQEGENSILINYNEKRKIQNSAVNLSSHNDHRIAMMIAIASTVYKGNIKLDNATCVKKSYPDFWKVFSSLGGNFYECMG